MACCIALAFVIASIRAVWFFFLPGKRPAETGFAPAAYRPGPGTGDAERTAIPRPDADPRARRLPRPTVSSRTGAQS